MRRFLMAFALVAATATAAAAQTAPSGARVEVEAYGSLSHQFDTGAAALALPVAGAPITTSSPLFPSRRVSSWLFGDGATLLNDVNAQLGVAARVTPLDAAIATFGRDAQDGVAGGIRLRLRTSEHVWLEAAVDLAPSRAGLSPEATTAIEQTRSSFVTAMTALLATGPFTGTVVTATAATDNGQPRDLTATLAANMEFAPVSGVTPYVTLGAGLITSTGTAPAFTLDARYRTRILGSVPIDESDHVAVRGTAATAPVVVIGAGLRREMTEHLHIRVDARLIAANRTISTNLDATPTVATGTPADFIESFTNPSVQFSNNTSTGRRSTLSGDAYDHLEVATSTRLQLRGLVTIGVAVRF